jgi:serine/threonine-protein kinase SRPK3
LGSAYNASADMWSMACLVFELVTGDFLFDPKSGTRFSRDDNHLAQMMELLGDIPRSLCLSGKSSKEFFTRQGRLRHIENLKYWPLRSVLVEKYDLDPEEVRCDIYERRAIPGYEET